MSVKDFVEVRFPAIAVEPDALCDAVTTAVADSDVIKTLEVFERQLYILSLHKQHHKSFNIIVMHDS